MPSWSLLNAFRLVVGVLIEAGLAFLSFGVLFGLFVYFAAAEPWGGLSATFWLVFGAKFGAWAGTLAFNRLRRQFLVSGEQSGLGRFLAGFVAAGVAFFATGEVLIPKLLSAGIVSSILVFLGQVLVTLFALAGFFPLFDRFLQWIPKKTGSYIGHFLFDLLTGSDYNPEEKKGYAEHIRKNFGTLLGITLALQIYFHIPAPIRTQWIPPWTNVYKLYGGLVIFLGTIIPLITSQDNFLSEKPNRGEKHAAIHLSVYAVYMGIGIQIPTSYDNLYVETYPAGLIILLIFTVLIAKVLLSD